jgi:hypothetical protein
MKVMIVITIKYIDMNSIVTVSADYFKESHASNAKVIEGLFRITNHKNTMLKHLKKKPSQVLSMGFHVLRKEQKMLVNRHPN